MQLYDKLKQNAMQIILSRQKNYLYFATLNFRSTRVHCKYS